jgi:uncharacterized membrane protein
MKVRMFSLNPFAATALIAIWVLFLGCLFYNYPSHGAISLVFPAGALGIAAVCVWCFRGDEKDDA